MGRFGTVFGWGKLKMLGHKLPELAEFLAEI